MSSNIKLSVALLPQASFFGMEDQDSLDILYDILIGEGATFEDFDLAMAVFLAYLYTPFIQPLKDLWKLEKELEAAEKALAELKPRVPTTRKPTKDETRLHARILKLRGSHHKAAEEIEKRSKLWPTDIEARIDFAINTFCNLDLTENGAPIRMSRRYENFAIARGRKAPRAVDVARYVTRPNVQDVAGVSDPPPNGETRPVVNDGAPPKGWKRNGKAAKQLVDKVHQITKEDADYNRLFKQAKTTLTRACKNGEIECGHWLVNGRPLLHMNGSELQDFIDSLNSSEQID